MKGGHSETCICDPCAGLRRQRKKYRIEYEQGLRRTTNAKRAADHLAALTEAGTSLRAVARATGVPVATLWRITVGQVVRIRWDTERKVVGFKPSSPTTNSRTVDATATRLRYQALVALGYTQAQIAREGGMSRASDLDLTGRVYRRTAMAMLDLCKRVGDTPGPSRKAATQALNRGWRVPADYDEEMFCDPEWDGTEPECAARLIGHRHSPRSAR